MSRNKLKSVPKFKNFKEETEFWHTHDLADYVDFGQRIKRIYPKNLEKKITVRFSAEDLARLKKVTTQKRIGVAVFIRLHICAYLAKLPHSV